MSGKIPRTSRSNPWRVPVLKVEASTTYKLVPVRQDVDELLHRYQAALPNSPGAEYLSLREIPIQIAQRCGVGYAAPERWAHPARGWREGRLVVPHTDQSGRVLNLYGRAIELHGEAPKHLRHDHLPAAEGRRPLKGVFNASALRSTRVFIAVRKHTVRWGTDRPEFPVSLPTWPPRPSSACRRHGWGRAGKGARSFLDSGVPVTHRPGRFGSG